MMRSRILDFIENVVHLFKQVFDILESLGVLILLVSASSWAVVRQNGLVNVHVVWVNTLARVNTFDGAIWNKLLQR